jgi:hypothetical protein
LPFGLGVLVLRWFLVFGAVSVAVAGGVSRLALYAFFAAYAIFLSKWAWGHLSPMLQLPFIQ